MRPLMRLCQCLGLLLVLVLLPSACSNNVTPSDGSVLPCTDSDDCPTGMTCQDGICDDTGTGCADGGTCPDGQICVADICVPDTDGGTDGGDGQDGDGDGDEPEPDLQVIEPGTTEGNFQLNFGNVLVGEPVTKQVVLENVGQRDLRIMQLNFEMGTDVDDFSIPAGTMDALPITVAPGEQLVFDVVYLATDGQTDHGILDVISNDPDEALVQIHLLSEFKGEARVQVDKLNLDFGEVPVGANSSPLGFVVTNNGTGNAVLAVEEVRFGLAANPEFTATITDSAGQPVAFPKLLNSGDFIDVSVVYHPAQAGPDADDVLVVSNDAINSTLRVGMTGTGVVGALLIVPSPVAFGQVRVNTHAEQVVTITNNGGADLNINGVALAADASAEWSLSSSDLDLPNLADTPHLLAAAESVTVLVSFDPADVGDELTTLLVDNSSAEPQRSVTVSASGFLPAAVETNPAPPNLNFGNVQYDELTGLTERLELPVQITNVGGQPLEINNIALSGLTSNEYSFAPSSIANINMGVTVPLTVSFEPMAPFMPGIRQGGINVDTNDPDISQDGIGGRFVIGMQANCIDPNIFVSPAGGRDFGDTYLGQEITQTFTIRNAGTGSLRVEAIQLSALTNASYRIENLPQLPAILSSFAQELTFDVVYSPVDANLHEGAVEIASNDIGNPLVGLSLTGNGLGCPAGTKDCDVNDGIPCETNTNTDVDNCGQCGVQCILANASATCVGGQCRVLDCDGDFENCDSNHLSGCETDTANDPLNCGACDFGCSFANATPECISSACQMGVCDPGFLNVDGSTANGCECYPDAIPPLCDDAAIAANGGALGNLPNANGNQILISGMNIYPAGDEDWYYFITNDNYATDINGCGVNCGDNYNLNIRFENNPQGSLAMDVYRSYTTTHDCSTKPSYNPARPDLWQGLVCSGHSDEYNHSGQNPCWNPSVTPPADSIVPRSCKDETSKYWLRVYRIGSTVTCDPYTIRISFTQ